MMEGQKKWFEHVIDAFPKDTKIQIDGRLISASIANERKKLFEGKGLQVDFV